MRRSDWTPSAHSRAPATYNQLMLTPHEWQEGIGFRASFIEGRLVQGAPILAVSIPDGVVVFSYRRHSRKIYEIYDRLAFSAIGQQSDVEALRVAALDFAHQEGFNRSEEDVTIRRVVSAMSAPIKRAFADFNSAPFVARSLFVEVCQGPEHDSYAILDYEGDFKMRRQWAYVAGTSDHDDALKTALTELHAAAPSPEAAFQAIQELWESTFKTDEHEGLLPEAVFLMRGDERASRFRLLTPED